MNTGGPAIQCKKCDTTIRSMYRHDFVECECGTIFIDGGSDYTRIGGHEEDWEWVKNDDQEALD